VRTDADLHLHSIELMQTSTTAIFPLALHACVCRWSEIDGCFKQEEWEIGQELGIAGVDMVSLP